MYAAASFYHFNMPLFGGERYDNCDYNNTKNVYKKWICHQDGNVAVFPFDSLIIWHSTVADSQCRKTAPRGSLVLDHTLLWIGFVDLRSFGCEFIRISNDPEKTDDRETD